MNSSDQIRGPDKFIEINKSKMTRWEFKKGRRLHNGDELVWAFGTIERVQTQKYPLHNLTRDQ